MLFDDFIGHRSSLIPLNVLNIRSEIWRQLFSRLCTNENHDFNTFQPRVIFHKLFDWFLSEMQL